MEVRNYNQKKLANLWETLGVKEEDYETEYDKEQHILSVAFDKNKIHVPEILTAVMSQMEVKDVQIEETQLEDIVKQIYHSGVK